MYRFILLSAAAVLAAALSTTTAHAVPAFTDIIAFGDSLTDTGNLAVLSPGDCPPSPPYDGCKFSNGPIWIEDLATGLGLPVSPGFGGGNNFAVAGAITSEVLSIQIPTYGASVAGSADPDALYVVWAGGNDGLGALSPFTAASNILTAISDLSALGADTFLIPNLPDLSLTPAALGDPGAALFSSFFNSTLATGLAGIAGVTIFELDVFALSTDIVTSPGTYGFTNVTDPCFTGTVCTTPPEYVWWDDIHPTTDAHAIIGDAALAAVPEPSTALLLSLGVVILAARRQRA